MQRKGPLERKRGKEVKRGVGLAPLQRAHPFEGTAQNQKKEEKGEGPRGFDATRRGKRKNLSTRQKGVKARKNLGKKARGRKRGDETKNTLH